MASDNEHRQMDFGKTKSKRPSLNANRKSIIMDIKIEAPGHMRQQETHSFYEEKLTKKYGGYDFIKAIDVKIKGESGQTEVSLQLKPEKGKMIYVSARDKSENAAFNHAIKNMNVKIEKYKDAHYHDFHHVNKNKREIIE